MPISEPVQKVYVVNGKNIPVSGSMAIADGANLDAFSRVRVSQPQGIFDGQFTYNLLPLQFEAVTAEANATVTHDATNRCATHTFAATPANGKAFLQSYEYVRYQPGRSQAAFVTFNFIEAKADCMKFAGLCDGTNGIEFRLNGTALQLAILSGTTNGDQIVAQADWSLDKLNGTGASGITLDITKTQILVIDFQALYVGRVRVGFDIGGNIIYAHEFKHANLVATPYMQTATLPIRCGMTCSGTVSTTMRFICSAVLSEGGQEENGGVPASKSAAITAAKNADTHILSIRPKTTFNALTNRIKVVLDTIELVTTGANAVQWQLCVSQALTGATWADVNGTHSSMECVAGAGTLSGTPALIVQSGYCAAAQKSGGITSPKISTKIPLTLNAAGAVRAYGTLTLLVQGIGDTSACNATLNWRELR